MNRRPGGASLKSVRRRARFIASLAVATIVGLVYPYLEVAWKCRRAADSEACVWARAYFPLSRWVEPLIVTPVAFLVIWLAARIGRPKSLP